MAGPVTLHVCITCRKDRSVPAAGAPDGWLMHAALTESGVPEGVEIKAVECLSACDNGCAIALSAPGRWTYVYGRLDPAEHSADILAGAAAYRGYNDGLIPWRERPVIFRKQCLARIPPQETTE